MVATDRKTLQLIEGTGVNGHINDKLIFNILTELK
jgi:hypothetical protein